MSICQPGTLAHISSRSCLTEAGEIAIVEEAEASDGPERVAPAPCCLAVMRDGVGREQQLMQPPWFNQGSGQQAVGQDTSQPTAQPTAQPTSHTSSPANGQFGGGPYGLSTPAQAAVRELADRAETLLARLREVEGALTDQEWWLMGRAMAEARVLAEMTSLLAVARGELETFLSVVGYRQTEPEDTSQRKEQDDIFDLMSDPMWMSGSREKAIALLRMCAAQVTPMRQYALVLQTNAERMGLSAVALDPLGITTERLTEAEELLRQPPR